MCYTCLLDPRQSKSLNPNGLVNLIYPGELKINSLLFTRILCKIYFPLNYGYLELLSKSFFTVLMHGPLPLLSWNCKGPITWSVQLLLLSQFKSSSGLKAGLIPSIISSVMCKFSCEWKLQFSSHYFIRTWCCPLMNLRNFNEIYESFSPL